MASFRESVILVPNWFRKWFRESVREKSPEVVPDPLGEGTTSGIFDTIENEVLTGSGSGGRP
jgi:hypothetical protein